jgi:SAF domain
MNVSADDNGGQRTVTAAPPPPPLSRRRGAMPPVSATPQGLLTRRRWGRFAAGATLALVGGWLFVALYLSAGARVRVLVMADDVGRYEVIEPGDVRVERVAAGPGVETIESGDPDDLVGRVAASDLPEGTLVAPNLLFAADARLVDTDLEGVVGARLAAGYAPDGALDPGTDVVAVIQPDEREGGTAREVPGWLLEVGDVDDQTRERQVSLVVPRASAAEVASAAADGRVAIVVLEGN